MTEIKITVTVLYKVLMLPNPHRVDVNCHGQDTKKKCS